MIWGLSRFDTEKAIKALSKKCLINEETRTIKLKQNEFLGLRLLGAKDWLVNRCGYSFIQ